MGVLRARGPHSKYLLLTGDVNLSCEIKSGLVLNVFQWAALDSKQLQFLSTPMGAWEQLKSLGTNP